MIAPSGWARWLIVAVVVLRPLFPSRRASRASRTLCQAGLHHPPRDGARRNEDSKTVADGKIGDADAASGGSKAAPSLMKNLDRP